MFGGAEDEVAAVVLLRVGSLQCAFWLMPLRRGSSGSKQTRRNSQCSKLADQPYSSRTALGLAPQPCQNSG
jgi:hypothetical protein